MATTKKTKSSSETGVETPAKKGAAAKAAIKTSPKPVKVKTTQTQTASKATTKLIPSESALLSQREKKDADVAVKKPATKQSASPKAVTEPATAKPAKKEKVVKVSGEQKKPSPSPKNIVQLAVQCDVGYGNKLYLRGDAPGLSWDRGIELENTSASEWIWKSPRLSQSCEVKVLLNDWTWDAGENLVLFNKKLVHYPSFG